MEDQEASGTQPTQEAPSKPQLVVEFPGEGTVGFTIRWQNINPAQMLAVRDHLTVVN